MEALLRLLELLAVMLKGVTMAVTLKRVPKVCEALLVPLKLLAALLKELRVALSLCRGSAGLLALLAVSSRA